MKLTAETTVEDVLAQAPGTAGVFVELGLPCFVCGEPAWGTVGELCERHGKDVAAVLAALNRAGRG
ncbi:MAG: DUF1858 domain-containing protein [bacterium]